MKFWHLKKSNAYDILLLFYARFLIYSRKTKIIIELASNERSFLSAIIISVTRKNVPRVKIPYKHAIVYLWFNVFVNVVYMLKKNLTRVYLLTKRQHDRCKYYFVLGYNFLLDWYFAWTSFFLCFGLNLYVMSCLTYWACPLPYTELKDSHRKIHFLIFPRQIEKLLFSSSNDDMLKAVNELINVNRKKNLIISRTLLLLRVCCFRFIFTRSKTGKTYRAAFLTRRFEVT